MPHMPALDGPNIASALTCVDVQNTDYGGGARGDGLEDDRAALSEAIEAAQDLGVALFLPPGTYRIGSALTNIGGDLRIVGQDATIKWDSTSHKALSFASDASRIAIKGVKFEGNVGQTELSHGNIQDALYFPSGNADITLRDCTFSWCRPNSFGGNSNVHIGRMVVDTCKFLNCTSVLNAPSYSLIRGCHFVNDAGIVGTNHGIYIFGEAESIVIVGNLFKNIAGNPIKFNNASARYGHKRSGVIANNFFEGGANYAIWIGADGSSDAVVSGFVISGNKFRNTLSILHAHNVSDLAVTGNVATWDWEGNANGPATGGIEISSAVAVGNLSPARNILVEGNTLRQLHPFVGKITFSAPPADGATFTVGATTYTWKNAPVAATDVLVQASASAAAQEAMHKLRGNRTAAMNVVLRGPEDAFYSDAELVIASDATFTLSAAGAGMTVTAVADKRVCTSAVHINETSHVTVRGNTFENFNWLYATKSVEPVFEDNTLIDCVIDGRANVRGKYRRNTITWRRARSAPRAGQATTQQVRVSDAWPIIAGNGLIRDQEYVCTEMLGASGVVAVSDGKAYVDLFYGSEVSDTSYVSTAFRWSDGDTVALTTHGGVQTTYTFKRSSPGAGEFNSAASLMALINAGGSFTAAYVSTTGFNDNVWIRITYASTGTTGNSAYVRVTTKSQTCGQLLLDANATPPDNAIGYLRGGNASANSTKTWCWTQLANKAAPPRVHGIDATSAALSPVVYQADIVPGVGFYITHGAAAGAGAEKFAWCIEAP